MDDLMHIDRITLVLGYRCNLDCPYCFLHNLPTIGKPMNKSLWEIVIKKIIKYTPSDVPIFISGGEPTLYFNLLVYIIKKLSKCNRKTLLVTNMTILDEEKIKTLIKNGLNYLQGTFHFYYIKDYKTLKENLLQVIKYLNMFKKISNGISILSINFTTNDDLLILRAINSEDVIQYLKDSIDVLELAILSKKVNLENKIPLNHLREYVEVEVSYYTEENEINEIVVTPEGYILPTEGIYPSLLKDPNKSKKLRNIVEVDLPQMLERKNWESYIKTFR